MHIPAWPVLPSSTLDADAIRAKFASRSLMGLRDVCTEGNPDYDYNFCGGSGQGIPESPSSPDPFGPLCPSSMMQVGQTCVSMDSGGSPLSPVNVGGTPGYVAPSQTSSEWASFAAQLLKSGMQLAQIQAIQPGTVVSANGAILRQSTGYAVPVTSSSTTLGLNASPNTTTLLIAGLAVAAVVFMGMKGGRG